MLKLFGEIAFVLGICLVIFVMVGIVGYAVVGGLCALTVLALLLARGPWAYEEDDEGDLDEESRLSPYAAEFFWRLVLSLALGAIWPSIPAIVYVKGGDDIRLNRPSKR